MQQDRLQYFEIEEENLHGLPEVIGWWETKRIWYNLLLFGIVAYLYFESDIGFVYGYKRGLTQTIVTIIIANVVYTFGWVMELWISYYFSRFKIDNIGRYVFYVAGSAFAAWIAWYGFQDLLR